MRTLDDVVVIVTGGAKGLGRTRCEALGREGARVVIADVDEKNAEAVSRAISGHGGRAVAAVADVTSEEGAAFVAQTAVDAFHRIDVLINNAGSSPHVRGARLRRLAACHGDQPRQRLPLLEVLAPMKAQRFGKIINVATDLVCTGLAGMVHYIAAKAGVVGFTRAFAREVGHYGIEVNAIAPGAVVLEDGLSESARARVEEIVRYQCLPQPRRSNDLVGTILFLASRDSDFISGQVLTVDGGLTTH